MVTQVQPNQVTGMGSRLRNAWQMVSAWRPKRSASSDGVNRLEPLCNLVIHGNDEQAQLVQRFLDLGRSALLLRPAIAQTISAPHLAAVREVIQHEMAWSPEGDVALVSGLSFADAANCEPKHIEHVQGFFLDRFPVTNRRFHEFVTQGGYSHEPVWDSTIWPRVSEFVDRTGNPGPRYWSNGKYPADAPNSPVVGVSWFEADAFARWAGKRLPTDAEWVKVATCPAATNGALVQRRFPWGDNWDPERGNLWISGIKQPSPVDQFSGGASASGVFHLIGNVWEWMSTDLSETTANMGLHFETLLKSLRGGAFDTYFESQATCQLQSGDLPIARRHNVGFRCALSGTDIVESEPRQ